MKSIKQVNRSYRNMVAMAVLVSIITIALLVLTDITQVIVIFGWTFVVSHLSVAVRQLHSNAVAIYEKQSFYLNQFHKALIKVNSSLLNDLANQPNQHIGVREDLLKQSKKVSRSIGYFEALVNEYSNITYHSPRKSKELSSVAILTISQRLDILRTHLGRMVASIHKHYDINDAGAIVALHKINDLNQMETLLYVENN